jgi:excinuclease ABC subunit C
VAEVRDVEVTITTSELEALVLEAELVRKRRPRYNADLAMAQRYAYIRITREEWPRVVRAWKVEKGAGEHYGPYPSGAGRNQVLRMSRRLFGLRSCKRMPNKACLYLRLGMCCAPCENRVSRRDYLHRVSKARRLLKGDVEGLARQLEREMKKYVKGMQYERAAECRDRLRALEHMAQYRKVAARTVQDVDIVAFEVSKGVCRALIIELRRGMVMDRHRLETEGLDTEGLVSLLCQHYTRTPVPDKVVLSRSLPNCDLLQEYLDRKREGMEVVTTADEDRELTELARIAARSLTIRGAEAEETAVMEDVKSILGLRRLPRTAACVDISTHHGAAPVGSWVVFREGQPAKDLYRRFAIREASGTDDPAMIAEVVQRRFTGSLASEEPPDLLLIDGGPTQLAAARRVLDSLGLSRTIDLASLAKEEECVHRPRRDPVILEPRTPAFRFCTSLRDEAHRFAVGYHRKKRSKSLAEACLTGSRVSARSENKHCCRRSAHLQVCWPQTRRRSPVLWGRACHVVSDSSFWTGRTNE